MNQMKKLIATIALSLTALSASALTTVSNLDFSKSIRSTEQHEWVMSGVYVWGLVDGANGSKFCIPKNTNDRELLMELKAHYTYNSAMIDRQGSAGVEITKFLAFAFPCK